VCWFAVRLALRPLQRMSAAAEAFGRDIRQPPLETSGPSEVRQAAQAFNAMQERVRSFMAERTQILAAVTHDLKTPMTRMRLRLENCNDEALREKLAGDLSAMQTLVSEGLDLARSLDSSEPDARIDLGALLSSIADDAADAGQPVTFSPPDTGGTLLATCRPNGLRRAIENLVDNALKYGQHAEISLVRSPHRASIHIRDHGPGIPEDQLEAVLRPFVRLETSRSRDSGGTGLGLAIANNLLSAQGASLKLANLPAGGLDACIELPLAGT
jgi:signal transduction histidine kinase